jgi:formylglycine-generating enzyme required for sulfatase activity
MSDPSDSAPKRAAEDRKQGVPSGPISSRRALFGGVRGDSGARSSGRLWLGLLLGGAVLLVGAFGYRIYARSLEIPPPSPSAVMPLPPPEDGPLLPLDAVVRVEGGTFKMGSLEGSEDERPVTETTVATFEIDLTEVTVVAYRACVEAGKCPAPDTGVYCAWDKPAMDRHPVNCVDWRQASAYCAFVGKRLPTEQEWEYAASGADGRKYPWKDGPPSNQLCWNGEGNDLGKNNRQGTCAVGRYPAGASPFGAFDMAGNVWEWTANSYCPSYEGKDCMEERKVIRGGGWNNVKAEYVRAQDRSNELVKARNDNVGFRCARTPK